MNILRAKASNILLASTILFATSNIAYADQVIETKIPESKIVYGSSGAVINMILFPSQNNKIYAQIPSIKRLSHADSFRVKLNLKKTNHIIYKVIDGIDKSGAWLTSRSELLDDNPRYTSIMVNETISDMTERYFIWYIFLDKSTGLQLMPAQAMKRLGFSSQDIYKQIKSWAKPCLNKPYDKMPDKCQDVAIENFVFYYFGDEQYSPMPVPSGVYIKGGRFGVSYDTNKFSVAFEFDLKTKKLVQP